MTTRREQLMKAAAELFVRHGYRKTSISDVTEAAGVSKGALYLEFASKPELYEAVLKGEFLHYLRDAETRVARDSEGGRLSRIYLHCTEAFLARPFLKSLYIQPGGVLSQVLDRHGPDRYRPRVLLGENFLKEMQEASLVTPEIDAATLSHTLSVLSLGPLLAEPLLHSHDSPPLHESLETLTDMVAAVYENSDGEPSRGKQAFTRLVNELSGELTHS